MTGPSPRSNDPQRFKLRMKFKRIRIQRRSTTWAAIIEIRKTRDSTSFKLWGLCWGFMRIPSVWCALPELGSSSTSKLSKNQRWPSIAATLLWGQAPTEQLDTPNVALRHTHTHTTKKKTHTNELLSQHYFSNVARIEPPWTRTRQETREKRGATNITWNQKNTDVYCLGIMKKPSPNPRGLPCLPMSSHLSKASCFCSFRTWPSWPTGSARQPANWKNKGIGDRRTSEDECTEYIIV